MNGSLDGTSETLSHHCNFSLFFLSAPSYPYPPYPAFLIFQLKFFFFLKNIFCINGKCLYLICYTNALSGENIFLLFFIRDTVETATALNCALTMRLQAAAGWCSCMIMSGRCSQGVAHPAIFSEQRSPLPTQKCLTAPCSHTYMSLYQPEDDNLVRGMGKCFISQLLFEDKACFPTVR